MLRKVILSVVPIAIGLGFFVARADLDDGLIAHWSFDEGTGNVLHDASGGGHDGTIHGATWSTGISGSALTFDGLDDYVDCGNDASLNIGTSDFSVAFWVLVSDSSWNSIVYKYSDGTASTNNHYRIHASTTWEEFDPEDPFDDRLVDELAVTVGDGGSWYINWQWAEITFGAWQHIAWVLDRDSNSKIYVNGVLASTLDVTSTVDISNTGPLVLGTGHDLLNGLLDEIRIYNRTLTPEEVAALAGTGVPDNQSPVADAGGPYYTEPGLEVRFDGSNSYDPDGTVVGYRWDWTNDGTWDTDWLGNPFSFHSYSFAFDGEVHLQVIDNEGATDVETAQVNVAVNRLPINGDFEEPFEQGWGIDGVDGLFATVTRVTDCDDDDDYEARVHRYAREGTTRLYQVIPITDVNATLSFKARLYVWAAPMWSAAVADVVIGYFDESDALLGRTDHLKTTYGTWPSTPTEHYVWVSDDAWHDYSFVLADEFATHLPGVDAQRVTKIKIVVAAISTGLLAGTAEACVDDFHLDGMPGATVFNVHAAEDPPASGKVAISYDLELSEQETATVSLQIDDGNGTWDVPVDSVSGDIGPSIPPGTGKEIIWNAGADIPCQFGSQFVARVVADGSSGDSDAFTIWAGTLVLDVPKLPVPRRASALLTATLRLQCGADPSNYVVSATVLTPAGPVVTPQWAEVPGDRFARRHELHIDDDDPVGTYWVEARAAGPKPLTHGADSFVAVENALEVRIGTYEDDGFHPLGRTTTEREVPDSALMCVRVTNNRDTVARVSVVQKAVVDYDPFGSQSLREYEAQGVIGSHGGVVDFKIPALFVHDGGPDLLRSVHYVDVWEGQSLLSPASYEHERTDYIVTKAADPDMLILTDPVALRTQFLERHWLAAEGCLWLLQQASLDGGCLVYSTNYHDGLREALERAAARFDAAYLLIVGGHEVVPFAKHHRDDCDDTSCWGSTDMNYWSPEEPSSYPTLAYGRIPTLPKVGSTTNLRIINRCIGNGVSQQPKELLNTVYFAGANECESVPCGFPDGMWHFLHMVHNEFSALPPAATYLEHGVFGRCDPLARDDLDTADLVLFSGHGGGNEHSGDGLLGVNLGAGAKASVYRDPESYGSILAFHADPDPAGSSYLLYNPSARPGGTPDELEGAPIVFSTGCLSNSIYWVADRQQAEENRWYSLGESFMEHGALAFGGFANLSLALSGAGVEGYRTLGWYWVESVGNSPTLGEVFQEAMTNVSDWLVDHGQNVSVNTFFVQFGYPKQVLTLPRRIASNGDRAAPYFGATNDSVDFELANYWFTTAMGGEQIEFTGLLNGEPVESEQWRLPGNPVVPHVLATYELPVGTTLASAEWSASAPEFEGMHNITLQPCVEYDVADLCLEWALHHATYMPNPVVVRVRKTREGTMAMVVDLFPFAYTPEDPHAPQTGEVFRRNNITVDLAYTDIVASLVSATFSSVQVLMGTSAELLVQGSGPCEIAVTIDNDLATLQTQPCADANVFLIPTGELTVGTHTADIECSVNGALNDETTRSFTVADKVLSFVGPAARDSVMPGVPLRVAWEITNDGIGQEDVSQVLEVCSGDQTTYIGRGTVSLDVGVPRAMAFDLATSDLKPGVAALRVKATVRGESFYSPFHHVVVVPRPRPEDADWDGDVDLEDFSHLQECFTGADAASALEICKNADYDSDGAVDLSDYEALFGDFGGPGPLDLVARVRPYRDAYEGNLVCPDGRRSTCEPSREIVAYEWQQIVGPVVNLIDADSPTPSFTAPEIHPACSATLKFALRVSDGYEWSDWSPSEIVTVRMACDANHDGVCDQGDIDFILEHWARNCHNEACLCDLAGDLDGNGNVGLSDTIRVTAEWGRSCAE